MQSFEDSQEADQSAGPPPAGEQAPSIRETTINSTLLHAYLAMDVLRDRWIEDVQRLHQQPPTLRHIDCSVSIPIDVAVRVAVRIGSRTLGRAALLAFIAEHHDTRHGNTITSLDAQLKQFIPLILFGVWVEAECLHRFLEIPHSYGPWIAGHIRKMKMKKGRHYRKLTPGRIANAEGDVDLRLFEATEIALTENTRRAEQVRLAMAPGFAYEAMNLAEALQPLIDAEAPESPSTQKPCLWENRRSHGNH